jgi:signal transduction histidine kinase
MVFQNIAYFISVAGIISLFILSVVKKSSLAMRKFSLLLALIAMWLGLQWIGGLLTGRFGSFLISLSVGLSPLIILSFLVFIYAYTNTEFRRVTLFYLLGLCGLFLISALLGVSISDVTFSNGLPTINQVSIIYWVQILFIIVVALAAVQKILSKFSKHQHNDADILLIIALMQALFFSLLASTVFASSSQSQILIPSSLLLMSLIIYYAIAKHQLFDIRAVAARFFVYLSSITFVVLIFTLSSFIIASQIFSLQITLKQELFFAFFSAAIALLFQPIKSFFDKFTTKIFYQDNYEPQELLNNLNAILVSSTDIQYLLDEASSVLERYLHPTFSNIILDTNNPVYDKEAIHLNKAIDSSVIEKLSSYELRTVTFNNLNKEDDTIRLLFNKEKINFIIFMNSNSYSDGYMVFGDRKSGNDYSQKDFQTIQAAVDSIYIATQNAIKYQKIKDFNQELEQKIDNATKKLVQSNTKLKELDSAKDEFISMASHQLRTPLTSVKGYISMILEGDAGEINDLQKKFLNQAFISSQRMVYLISDLLNVSRLKTGKFVIENRETYLPDTVEDELRQLDETIKARGLSIDYKKPKKFPTVMLDEDKVRQVIMNFADNAIYYTPAGGKIIIELKATDEVVKYTVKDTGIGVPKHEQHHLFTKFYRAGNARKARPDGTGLGLFMAKKVITAQGGSILFTSEEGKGSTFGFSLPRKKVEKTT